MMLVLFASLALAATTSKTAMAQQGTPTSVGQCLDSGGSSSTLVSYESERNHYQVTLTCDDGSTDTHIVDCDEYQKKGENLTFKCGEETVMRCAFHCPNYDKFARYGHTHTGDSRVDDLVGKVDKLGPRVTKLEKSMAEVFHWDWSTSARGTYLSVGTLELGILEAVGGVNIPLASGPDPTWLVRIEGTTGMGILPHEDTSFVAGGAALLQWRPLHFFDVSVGGSDRHLFKTPQDGELNTFMAELQIRFKPLAGLIIEVFGGLGYAWHIDSKVERDGIPDYLDTLKHESIESGMAVKVGVGLGYRF